MTAYEILQKHLGFTTEDDITWVSLSPKTALAAMKEILITGLAKGESIGNDNTHYDKELETFEYDFSNANKEKEEFISQLFTEQETQKP
jgi:hypothetical protein